MFPYNPPLKYSIIRERRKEKNEKRRMKKVREKSSCFFSLVFLRGLCATVPPCEVFFLPLSKNSTNSKIHLKNIILLKKVLNHLIFIQKRDINIV